MSGTPFFRNILNTYAHLIFIQPITYPDEALHLYPPICKLISYSVLIESYQGHITLIDIFKISHSSKEALEIWGERDVM